MIEGVVFDFGGVLVKPQEESFYGIMEARFGWTRAFLRAGWARYRAQMDAGTLSAEAMYRRMAADAGRTLTDEEAAFCRQADYDSWAHPDAETQAWARELKAAGYKIGILTNMPPDFMPWFDRGAGAVRALADAEAVSGAERLIKPDPAIYRLMERRIGLPPEKLFFLDDTQANVDGARACGWRAHRFTDADSARRAFSACAGA